MGRPIPVSDKTYGLFPTQNPFCKNTLEQIEKVFDFCVLPNVF